MSMDEVAARRETESTRMKWDARRYAGNARFVAEYGEDVLDLLAVSKGQRVLDIGCGDGVLTAQLAARGAEVVGVDTSPDLLGVARASGLDVRLQDAQALQFAEEFDAAFSNAALHWMPRLDDVLAGVNRALRPGGRFVGELGGQGNVAAIHTALIAALRARGITERRSPWYFPVPYDFERALRAHGFDVEWVRLIPRPTQLVTGMRNWLETFATPFAIGFDSAKRDAFFDEVVTLLEPALRDAGGNWTADYVRLRFVAAKAERINAVERVPRR